MEDTRKLKKIIELKQHEIDKYGFCPDCRDKVDGECYRCKNDKLKAENERLSKALFEIAQAPYPLHDYCSKESWEFACNFVSDKKSIER